MRDWAEDRRELVHNLNGQLLEALKERLVAYGNWDPEDWIVNVIVLRRIIEEREEAFLKTSATMLKGKIYSSLNDLNRANDIGDFDRVVPLKNSFSGYCIRTGNVVWVDDIKELTPDHPLYQDYRPFEYVSVIPESQPTAEYVFPIRVQIGLSEAILGVVNAECTQSQNQFKEWGFHQVLHVLIKLLDVHGPFLVVAEHVEVNKQVKHNLLNTHRVALEATMLARDKEMASDENR
jgi:hypothetical protein